MDATGLPLADVKLALERAAELWNEESGSSIRLRVRGTTSSLAISQAIVVSGDAIDCDNTLANSSDVVSGSSSAHRFVSGGISIRKYDNKTTPVCGPQISWCVRPNDSTCVDLVEVLVHELGHGAYNLNHPDSGRPDCDTVTDPLASVMWSEHQTLQQRMLKQWELELAQTRYTPRTNSATISRLHLVPSAGVWTTAASPSVDIGAGTRPLVRMGSMPQNVTLRSFAWVTGNLSASLGGTGYVADATYNAGTIANFAIFGGWSLGLGLTRPVAFAGYSSGSTTPLLMAYQKYYSPQPALYSYTASYGNICYRTFANGLAGGVSAETCSGLYTAYFGLTAAYDAYSNTYLIGYIADDSMHIGILEVPGPGNVTTPVKNTILAVSSYHAPSIACSGVVNGCKIAYEAATNYGFVSWLDVGVSAVTGSVSVNTSWTTGRVAMDTPSIAYDAADGTFRVAYTIDNYAIYSFKLFGDTVGASPDVFNDFNSFVSSPVTAPRSSVLYTWYLKYW